MNDWKQYYEFNYGAHISLRERWLYVETPKCACTTIKELLARSVTSNLGPYSAHAIAANVHSDPAASPHVKPYLLPPKQLHDCLFGSNFLRFACIRDPFERFVSAFRDKVLGRASHAMEFLSSRPEGLSPEDEFARFVDYVGAIDDPARDRHWRSQFQLLGAGSIRYHVLLSFENLTADWEELRLLVPTLPEMRSSQSSSIEMASDLRPVFEQAVQSLYPQDDPSHLRNVLGVNGK